MSEHEPSYNSGQCSQGCGRRATTPSIRLREGIEWNYPMCEPCFEQEIAISNAIQSNGKGGSP